MKRLVIALETVDLVYGFTITVALEGKVYVARLLDPLGNTVEAKRSISKYTTSKNIIRLKTLHKLSWCPETNNEREWH